MGIRSEHVSFSYRKKEILKGVNFTVHNGKITYLAGKNGSGKTTWILLSAGLLRLRRGSIRFDGKRFEEARPRVSISFDTSPLYPGLTLLDNLMILYDLNVRDPRIREHLQTFGLTDALLRLKASRLSYGQRHRAGIAGALLRSADYLILDEPDLGLDPAAWEATAKLLRSLRNEGKCILLTGQHFETISSLIDDVIVLDHGRLLFEGSAKMFQGQWAAKGSEQADLKSAFEHIINVKGSACPASGKEDLL